MKVGERWKFKESALRFLKRNHATVLAELIIRKIDEDSVAYQRVGSDNIHWDKRENFVKLYERVYE